MAGNARVDGGERDQPSRIAFEVFPIINRVRSLSARRNEMKKSDGREFVSPGFEDIQEI